jgi:hypothetical protein
VKVIPDLKRNKVTKIKLPNQTNDQRFKRVTREEKVEKKTEI